MPYRDDADALRNRCDLLEKELADVRTRARELESLKRTEADVARDLEKARAMLDSLGARGKTAPSLDNVRIASPCKASWDDMQGDERVRFCGKCEKNVFNLSAMSKSEAEALLFEKDNSVCARIFRRADGTVMTTDCPVGVRTKRVRRLAIIAAGGGVLTAVAAALSGVVIPGECAKPMQGQVVTMGTVAAPPPTAPEMGEPSVATMGSVALPSPPPSTVHPEPKRR